MGYFAIKMACRLIRFTSVVSSKLIRSNSKVDCQYFHTSAISCLADKSFGGKSIRDKPIKETTAAPKREKSEDEKKRLDQDRKEREQAKKLIRQKQLEIQKKREEVAASKTQKKTIKKQSNHEVND